MEKRLDDQGHGDKPSDPMATPLTDEEVETAKKFPLTSHGLWVSAEFARDLERQLTDAKQRINEWRDLLEKAERPTARSAGTRTDWPLDTLCGVACDDLFKAYGIEFPRTHSDLRRCFATAEKYLRTAQSASERIVTHNPAVHVKEEEVLMEFALHEWLNAIADLHILPPTGDEGFKAGWKAGRNAPADRKANP